ncbi:MAG: hypothetical protein ACKO0X_04495 [Bacteroidota bacterium]
MNQFSGFENQRPVVVVTSDEPWSDVWHTQIHYAAQLARFFNVVFVGPPKKWSLSNLINVRFSKKVIDSNLVVCYYFNWMPAFLGKVSIWINDWINYLLLNKSIGGRKVVGVWHFDRYRGVYFFRRNKSIKHIYHVIDPVADLNFDNYLAKHADLVISVSQRFMEHYLNLNDNVAFEGQGWDPDSLQLLHSTNESSNLYAGSILLLGSFLDDVDYELLIHLRNETLGTPMVLIGPDKTTLIERKEFFKQLLGLPEVFWLGSLPPEKHIPYIASSGVCLIAYELTGKVFNRKRVFGTPLKVLSYLGCHKNVVSNIDCEIPVLVGKGIYYEKTAEGFIRRVKLCLDGKVLVDSALIDQYLDSMSYIKIINRVFQRIGVETI